MERPFRPRQTQLVINFSHTECTKTPKSREGHFGVEVPRKPPSIVFVCIRFAFGLVTLQRRFKTGQCGFVVAAAGGVGGQQ